MFHDIDFILKNDLSFSFSKEEVPRKESIQDVELENLRKNLLDSIRSHRLAIDVLEERLEELKKQEFCLHLQKGTSKISELEEQLDRKCTKLLINLVKGNATVKSLLDPSSHLNACKIKVDA